MITTTTALQSVWCRLLLIWKYIAEIMLNVALNTTTPPPSNVLKYRPSLIKITLNLVRPCLGIVVIYGGVSCIMLFFTFISLLCLEYTWCRRKSSQLIFYVTFINCGRIGICVVPYFLSLFFSSYLLFDVFCQFVETCPLRYIVQWL
jgi:hypothetical protein